MLEHTRTASSAEHSCMLSVLLQQPAVTGESQRQQSSSRHLCHNKTVCKQWSTLVVLPEHWDSAGMADTTLLGGGRPLITDTTPTVGSACNGDINCGGSQLLLAM